VHLHYANYGIRKLVFRLPHGLPITADALEHLETDSSLQWMPDAEGNGGLLSVVPECDGGDYYQDFYDFDGLIESLPQIRSALMAGDLRPLYVAWLACVYSDEAMEPPVPGGLKTLPEELKELARFYELPLDLIAAAANIAPAAPARGDQKNLIDAWLQQRSADELRSWLRRVACGEGASVQSEILAAIRSDHQLDTWPTAASPRTYGQLYELAQELASARRQREGKAADRARLKRLKSLAAEPDAAIAEAQKLVEQRSTEHYRQAATILAELRDALGPIDGIPLANAAAREMTRKYPTLSKLKRALRDQGLSYE
jgi:hypothetical protein